MRASRSGCTFASRWIVATTYAPDATPSRSRIVERSRAIGAFLESVRDQRERRRRDDGAAGPLDDAGADEPPRRGGEPAGERTRGEQQDPRDEHPAPAEEITSAAAQQQQTAEGERVAVDDPLQVGGIEAQGMLDRRQSDVHDGGVEHDHQLRKRDDEQRDVDVAGRRGATQRQVAGNRYL